MQAPTQNIENLRNIGIMAHIDAGKTTTTERILFDAGASHAIGDVDDGTAVTDWMAEEQARGISITAAATTLSWRGHQINLIDTPGHVDFTIEVERSLRVLDGAIAVICAVHGVEPQTETVWRQADRHSVPRLIFVNKCDRDGADMDAAIASIHHRLSMRPLVLHVPVGLGKEFVGVVDLVRMKFLRFDAGGDVTVEAIPDALLYEAKQESAGLRESLADLCDAYLEKYLAGEDNEADVVAAIRRCTLERIGVPVLVGAALSNYGIGALLDAVVDYLPSPLEVSIDAQDPKTAEPLSVAVDTGGPLAALAFKVMMDPRMGQLTFVRVYSGTLQPGMPVFVPRLGASLEVPRLVRMHANHGEFIDALGAGDIGAALGATELTTGDTLCTESSPVQLGSIPVPEPVIGIAVEPRTDEDLQKLQSSLAKLAAEDPTLLVRLDPDSQQTIISGMGELHLEIVLERLRNEFAVNARAGKPQVAYRETITRSAEHRVRDNRGEVSTGARTAALRVSVKPTPRGEGIIYQCHQALPLEIDRAIRDSIFSVASAGVASGFPLTDIRIEVDRVVVDPIDAPAASFGKAAVEGLRTCLISAAPTLLEPTMAVEIICPNDAIGDIMGDFTARRGNISGISARTGVQVIAGFVPLANMFGYATDLRSRTSGRASFSMQFQAYQEVPNNITKQILSHGD